MIITFESCPLFVWWWWWWWWWSKKKIQDSFWRKWKNKTKKIHHLTALSEWFSKYQVVLVADGGLWTRKMGVGQRKKNKRRERVEKKILHFGFFFLFILLSSVSNLFLKICNQSISLHFSSFSSLLSLSFLIL